MRKSKVKISLSSGGRPLRDRPHVALLIETSKTYGRGLLRGVTRYVRTHRSWSIYIDERGLDDPLPAWLEPGSVDGLILRSLDEGSSRVVRNLGAPVVYLGERNDTGLPMLHSDDRAVVHLAIDHLAERGFQRFAYVGLRKKEWSDRRRDFFTRRVSEIGGACEIYEFPLVRGRHPFWPVQERRLHTWLARLAKPVAVMACYDVMGVRVIDACRKANLAVPEQVAVIGVDNDSLLCELADPPLSSVAHDLQRIGYEAAATLDRLMKENPSHPPPVIEIEPSGVEARQSTDVLAIDDEKIAEAMRFIRQQATKGIKVLDVMHRVNMTRVTLNRRFGRIFARTPKEEILRLQIERCKQLLLESDFILEKIAALAGFEHPEYMSVVFKRETGLTPGAFRQQSGR